VLATAGTVGAEGLSTQSRYTVSLEPLYVAKDNETIRWVVGSQSEQEYLVVLGRRKKTVVIDQSGKRREWDAVWYPSGETKGLRMGYSAIRGHEVYVVIEGMEYGGYDYVPQIRDLTTGLFFSADAKHWMFRATRDDEAFAVLDGQEVARHSSLTLYPPFFCPDGSSWAIVGLVDRQARVILNDLAGPRFSAVWPFAEWSDSCQFSYIGYESDSLAWLIAGMRRWGPFAAVKFAHYLPSGNDLMYGARYFNEDAISVFLNDSLLGRYEDIAAAPSAFEGPISLTVRIANGRYQIVRDTFVSPPYDSLSQVTTDRSGKRWVYAAYTRNKKRRKTLHPFDIQVALNGVLQPTRYWSVGEFFFSKDGSRLQFLVTDDKGECRVVIDSTTYGPYDTVTTMAFSEDSRQFGFIYEKDGEHRVNVNGFPSKPYRRLEPLLHFHPRRPGAIWFAADQNDIAAVTDDSILVRMDKLYCFWAPFDSTGTLHFFGQRADTVYRVTVAVPWDAIDSTDTLRKPPQ